jgi:uncharacterized damage-inducible protein DinB
MERSLAAVSEIFNLNTRLLLNCIVGVSDAHAAERMLPGTNSMAFVVAHVIDARHFVAKLLGKPTDNPLAAALDDVKRIEDVTVLPPLIELREMWFAVGKHLEDCLTAASADLPARPSPQTFPVGDDSLLGGIAFLAQHESYHIGQLALLRKALGYPPMSYEHSVPGEG